MDQPWTDAEKAVARSVLKKVESRAKTEVIRRFKEYQIETPDDVWNLEQEIRSWRKDLRHFNLNYNDLEQTFATWLDQGLLKISEIAKLEEERLGRIKKKQR